MYMTYMFVLKTTLNQMQISSYIKLYMQMCACTFAALIKGQYVLTWCRVETINKDMSRLHAIKWLLYTDNVTIILK